jgi:pyrroloquinoline-quinone synthase
MFAGSRISIYDGRDGHSGGRANWLALGHAVDLSEADLVEQKHLLRGVRFAVDTYLRFCQTRPWTDGAAAALTEMFAPDHMAQRVAAWREHYDWIKLTVFPNGPFSLSSGPIY